MKGIIIYGNPMWGDNERAIYCEFINEASFELKNVYGSKEFTSCLKGEASECSKAICSPEDTYDFETGALISLMKLCGREKVTKACDELYRDDIYKNALQEMTENCEKLMEENEKLQHEYDLCKNSENALKCSVDYLNKTIAKLNTAIYGYKEDLYKVSKRCKELELKENILNKQEETINKREEEMSTYFGGRGNGKQYKALVELFKKIPKDKVQAAYVTAYKESLIWCTSQPSIRDSLDKLNEPISKLTVDSLIEESRAFTRKCVDEWLYGPPTKREEMWENIINVSQDPSVDIKVAKQDIKAFLKELQDKIPEAKWNGSDCLPTEYTNPYWFKHDYIYFGLFRYIGKGNLKICYDESPHSWINKPVIEYLPPMRWDLFKKGRIVVKVNHHNYEDFYNKCEVEIGRKPHYSCKGTFTVYYSKGTFHTRPYDEKIPYKHKVVNWEDVR